MEIFYRELNRLDNDIDRLQMISILKSHLNQIEIDVERLCRCFHDEFYRFKALEQMIPFISNEALTLSNNLVNLFETARFRLHLIELLKYSELSKEKHLNQTSRPPTRQSSMSFQIDCCQNSSISTQTTPESSTNFIDGSGDSHSEFI